jgi:hypothetical protein
MIYTREILIKSVVAEEMRSFDGNEYTERLKNTYHKWEHASSYDLCKRYGELTSVQLTVDALTS